MFSVSYRIQGTTGRMARRWTLSDSRASFIVQQDTCTATDEWNPGDNPRSPDIMRHGFDSHRSTRQGLILAAGTMVICLSSADGRISTLESCVLCCDTIATILETACGRSVIRTTGDGAR